MQSKYRLVFQEFFALHVTRFKRTRWFLKTGAGDVLIINNALLVESALAERGIGLGLEPNLVAAHNSTGSNLSLFA